MSNRAYLTACEHERIYPWFGDLPFDRERDLALACDGCVPLLWLAAFSAGDLMTHRFTLPSGREIEACAPLCERERALERIGEREKFLDDLFADNGGLRPFTAAFVRELGGLPGKYLSIEYEEIAALGDPDAFDAVVTETLRAIDAFDPKCKNGLLDLSTVIDDRRFLPPEAATESEDREDRWNVFRILGGGFVRPAHWDSASPNAGLQQMLARQRPRGAFALWDD